MEFKLLPSEAKMNKFPVEITFEGVKYTFQVSRMGPSLLELAIADKKQLSQFPSHGSLLSRKHFVVCGMYMNAYRSGGYRWVEVD